MSRRTLAALALAALAGTPSAAEEPARRSGSSREGIESLEALLARAVDRVSLPHAARLLGRVESARGYRLPGYGVVFVLSPRTLPGGEGHVYVLRGGPGARRLRIETRRPGPGPVAHAPDEAEIEALERQVLVLQHETESYRRAAEEQMEQLVRDVRVRVSPGDEMHVEMVSPPPPPPPATPAPEAPPATPAAPEAPPAPPAPPWKFWFEAGAPEEKREPAAVVADVRVALVEALAAQGAALEGLGAEERVAVTVDFVAGGVFAAQARPEKTLVLSARVRDLAGRARGAMSLEEFRRRVEVTEY